MAIAVVCSLAVLAGYAGMRPVARANGGASVADVVFLPDPVRDRIRVVDVRTLVELDPIPTVALADSPVVVDRSRQLLFYAFNGDGDGVRGGVASLSVAWPTLDHGSAGGAHLSHSVVSYSGGDAPRGLALNAALDQLYYVDESRGELRIVDLSGAAPERVLSVGGHPLGSWVDPQGAWAFVVDPLSGTLSRFSVEDGAWSASVELGSGLSAIGGDRSGERILVARAHGSTVFALDPESLRVLKAVRVGGHPLAICVGDPTIVVNLESSSLSILDVRSLSASSLPTVRAPFACGVGSDGRRTAVVGYYDGEVEIVEAATVEQWRLR